MELSELKLICASNLIRLRTAAGLTQAELGAKLNYSDKSVSKWERGEAIPDAWVLTRLAEIFDVTVDYILSSHDAWVPPDQEVDSPQYSRGMIYAVAIVGVWTMALTGFVVLWWIGYIYWQAFFVGLTASAIVYLGLSIYFKRLKNLQYMLAALVLSIFILIYVLTLPFGNNWLLSHTERSVANAVMDGNDARINMTKSTMEMTATQFRYYNEAGEKVEYEKVLVPEENEMVLPNAKKGKRFEFRSAYKPEKGMDIVWTPNWSKSPDALAYALPTNTWDVTVTKDQEFSTFTVDKIFDGVVSSSNRWHCKHKPLQSCSPSHHFSYGHRCSASNLTSCQEHMSCRFPGYPDRSSRCTIHSSTAYSWLHRQDCEHRGQ